MREGWIETTLGEISTLQMGRTPSRHEPSYWTNDLTFPFCTIADMNSKFVNPVREGVTQIAINDGKAKVAKSGTLLMSFKLTIGRMAFAARDIYPNEAIVMIDADERKVLNEFLYLRLGSMDLTEGSGRAVKGSTLNSASIASIGLLIPPLHVQRRIVDLISSVDSYIEALQQQLESAKKSKNAVLHELLTAGGDDWVETTLGNVALLNPPEPPLASTDYFAPMDAVSVGKRWLQYTEERGNRAGARARTGDVLFARITPCLENGKVAQVQTEIRRCGGSTEFIVIRGSEKCSSDFIYFWSTLKLTRDQAKVLMTGTTGRQRLSARDLSKLPVHLPPVEEQKRIVELMVSMDSQIENIETAISKTQRLRSALLSDLLSGNHEIPASYEQVMDAAS